MNTQVRLFQAKKRSSSPAISPSEGLPFVAAGGGGRTGRNYKKNSTLAVHRHLATERPTVIAKAFAVIFSENHRVEVSFLLYISTSTACCYDAQSTQHS